MHGESDGTEEVLSADGTFHATDAPIDFHGYSFEAWIALTLFWLLLATIFYQFFTRYVLNDSAAWTEEIARYLLICTVFMGAAMAVHRNTHIHVDFLFRLLPKPVGRVVSTLIDVCRFIFFSCTVVLTWQMMEKAGTYRMTIIDLPMNIIYGFCLICFALMAVRAGEVMVRHWRRGYSVLERPETGVHEA